MQNTRYWPNFYAAHLAAFAREVKQNDEIFRGRNARNSAVAGIQARAAELEAKLAKLQSDCNPNQEHIARIQEILKNLRSTLTRCR